MLKHKRSLAAAGAALVTLLAATAAHAQKTAPPPTVPPPQNVKVVNTPEEPVPVTGTVSVSNLGTDPLPVRDVDNPARQPFQTALEEDPFPNAPFKVPAGKRLVIEHVSAEIPADTNCAVIRYALKTTAGGSTLEHFFYPEPIGSIFSDPAQTPSTFRIWGLSQVTRIYADPDTEVTIRYVVSRSVGTGCGFGPDRLRISGHLVDAPQQ